MTEVCVDAGLIVKLVLNGEALRAQAHRLYEDAALAGARLIAPPVFESEVDSVIRARAHSGRLTARQARYAWAAIDGLSVEIENPLRLRKRARLIAEKCNQERVYGSTYAALAEIRGCEFWTADHAFHQAVKDDLAFVKYLADYPVP